MGEYSIQPGKSHPLGATVYPNGVNFCIFSKQAEALELLLFEEAEVAMPYQVIALNSKEHRTFYYWHVFVERIGAGQVYAYRAYGEFNPSQGLLFDSSKVLLDPYACAVVGWESYDRQAAISPGDNCAHALRGVVVESSDYNWEDDSPLEIPYADSVIYELHVGGFTRNPNSGVAPHRRGTYAGLIEKIPYLKDLGITAVELLPIHQFDDQEAPPGLTNYWGYSPISFFAPHIGYSSRKDPTGPLDEFRDMVKALHRAGIEVILDVVFNHTAEGDHRGPTLSFKGLDNQAYYMLEADNPSQYSNYSGCGNTLKANHEIAGRLILDSLRYWVAEMHVDGFRFDLASVLSRSRTGRPMEDPPILWVIESDPILAGTKIIAEAWDAAGLYQVGTFIGDRFAEWNGPYRDEVRQFVKANKDMVSKLAARIMASPDIYHKPDREPNRSINFITCHDGFTLNDVVSFNDKHNEANREDNRDGSNDNHSWNCGIEGPTDDANIEYLRQQQIKNFLTILLMSQGTPMLLMGDEVRRSQGGNNNAYCQDNELSWFDWDLLAKNAGLLRFTQGLIEFIQSHDVFRHEYILHIGADPQLPYIEWHGVKLHAPDLNDYSHTLAYTLGYGQQERLHIMFNSYWEPLTFQLPPSKQSKRWHCLVDTALPSPKDFQPVAIATRVSTSTYDTHARSAVVLIELEN
ncbi:MAG: glycogen debranching protein GlgX [Cyanobacteria bacterium P01_A01_bin.123]